MILVDSPGQRHICPVTLFLALAIADGAIKGISSRDDLLVLAGREHSDCITLPYNHNVGHLPVLRRTRSKSKAMSSCAMKSSVLHKMMQAQISRAGHENTFNDLLRDVRMSSQREKRRTWLLFLSLCNNSYYSRL